MFSGIISDIGKIVHFDKSASVIGIKSNYREIELGESISCSGICLTVSSIEKNILFFNISSETISRTNLSFKHKNDFINLEKSMKMNSILSGHLVFGHVDGIANLISIEDEKDSKVLEIGVDSELIKFLTPKCSIAIDGISLTVNEVLKNKFKVSIIPHTWNQTTLKYLEKEKKMNVEIDMLARYVFRAIGK